MFRIGIIGTENSHAMAFSKILNLPDEHTGKILYPDARVVAVYGPDKEPAELVAKEAKVDCIVNSPEELIGKVDAVMLTSRKGSVHYGYAMPLIEKGIPMFIDKPFTIKPEEARALIAAAKKNGVPLTGGSGCKLAYDTLLLRNTVRDLKAKGEMITGCINFPADPDDGNDGFFFYASHLTEMALTVFGYDIRSVMAFEKNKSRVVVCRYDDYDVTFNYTKDDHTYTAVIYAKSGNTVRYIDISLIYWHEVEHFIHMLRTGEMYQPYEELIKPVFVINAIEESVKTGREVAVEN